MNSNRSNLTRKGKLSSSIVSFALIGSAFLLAAVAMQSSPTGVGGDPPGAAALIVTTTNDIAAPDGKISLREAVTTANSQAGMDTITFNIPASEGACTAPNACTITLATALPAITDDVTIDGAPNNGHITINGNHTIRSGFAVNSQITLNVQNLTLANGNANDGGAIQINGGSVTAANVTVTGNSSLSTGGGIAVFGGTLHVSNSTFFGNSSSIGGGIYAESTVQVTNSTFFSNNADQYSGGGILASNATVTLRNSIIANNMNGGDCQTFVGGQLIADSHNLNTDNSCSSATTTTTDEINLQPLADNGGPTMTMALKLPSAAVDTGDNAVAAAPPVNNLDQRGVTRPQDGNNDGSVIADIGAYELRAFLVVTTTDDVIAADGKTSLREAVTTANSQAGMDTIAFNIPASESGCAAPNACTIALATELPAINDDMTIDGLPNDGHIIVSGNHSVRGFLVNPTKTFNVQNLTIANGKSNDCPPFNVGMCGGAIQINGGTVNAVNITVMGNAAQTRAGGIGVFGIANGTLNMTNSTLFGNSSNEGGGIYSSGTLRVTNSTLSGNSAIAGGGGIVNVGQATLKNSIIANSTHGDCANGGMLIADSHNLDTDGSCGNARTGYPNLQPLADNGGSTMTMAMKLPSVAVDEGDDVVAVAPPVNFRDQRGVSRRQDNNNSNHIAVSDIGAYELAVPLVVTTTDDTIAADGRTSLREAITTANDQVGPDLIKFSTLR